MKTAIRLYIATACMALFCAGGLVSCGYSWDEDTPTTEFGIWETYELAELLPMLQQVNDETRWGDNQEDCLFYLLNPHLDAEGKPLRGAMAGHANIADTARVMAILQSEEARAILPRTVRFAWMHKPSCWAEDCYDLVLLKAARHGGPALDIDIILGAKARSSRRSYYRNTIDIQLTQYGTKVFQRFSRDNIGKSIAFVLDGEVYSVPTVVAEISGGKLTLAADFTQEEARLIAKRLSRTAFECVEKN